MTDTQQCRAEAAWRQIGTQVYKLPKYVYRIPCMPGGKVVDHIGAIKERNDGRWNWWRMRTNFHPTWNGEGQGVADSRGAAEMRVLEGWAADDELQATRDFQGARTLTPLQAECLKRRMECSD
jgi:hypothetical protein